MPLQIPIWILYNNPIQSERLFLFNVFTPNWFALYNIHALVTSLEPMGCFLWQRDNMARLLQAMGSQLCSPGPSTPVSMQQQWELFQNCNCGIQKHMVDVEGVICSYCSKRPVAPKEQTQGHTTQLLITVTQAQLQERHYSFTHLCHTSSYSLNTGYFKSVKSEWKTTQKLECKQASISKILSLLTTIYSMQLFMLV